VDAVFSYSICLSVSLLEKWSGVAYVIGKKENSKSILRKI
jgi:hypothetical protein